MTLITWGPHEDIGLMRIWGYWATLGWGILAFFAGQIISLGILLWLHGWNWDLILQSPFDGVLVTLFVVISNPIMIGLLVLAVRLARCDQRDYFALNWPSGRDLVLGIVLLIVLIAASDALLYFTGRDLVTPFQLQSYASAKAAGWLPALLAASILVAPAGEEALFRGFLFRGWARSPRAVWAAIVVISALWAGLHVQYDWTGVLQIFVVGLFLGWMRWRGGSMLLPFLLHALFNLEGTLETLVQVHFFTK
ncbi:MAG: type II CAAX endopeptidase family protein [Xanthobacteraceae bacterium]